MVGHLAKSVNHEVASLANPFEDVEPRPAIPLVAINRLTIVTPGGNVIKGSRKFKAKWTCYPLTLNPGYSMRSDLPQ
jgi:hypothetical protein